MAYRYDNAHYAESTAPDCVVKGIFAGAKDTEYELQICRSKHSVFAKPKSKMIKTNSKGGYNEPIPIVDCQPASGAKMVTVFARYRLKSEHKYTEDAEKHIFYKCTQSAGAENKESTDSHDL